MTATATAAGPLAVSPVGPEDHVLILFGATGDLAKRKLLPGLFRLAAAGRNRPEVLHRFIKVFLRYVRSRSE